MLNSYRNIVLNKIIENFLCIQFYKSTVSYKLYTHRIGKIYVFKADSDLKANLYIVIVFDDSSIYKEYQWDKKNIKWSSRKF